MSSRKTMIYSGALLVMIVAVVVWIQDDSSSEEVPPVMIQYQGETYYSKDFFFQTDGYPTPDARDTGEKANSDAGMLADGRIFKDLKTGELFVEDKSVKPSRWILYSKK